MDRYQSKKLIDAVFLYLNGERVSLIQGTIVAISAESEKHARELYKAIKVTPLLEGEIFQILRVPPSQQKFYTNAPHLLHLLTHLHQDGYGFGHLSHFLNLVNDTNYNFYRRLRTATLLTLGLGGVGLAAHFKPDQILRILTFVISRLPLIILKWIEHTFSLLKNLTFIGAAYALLRYTLFIYHTFYHGFSNLTQKLSALFFRTMAVLLNLIAYAIIFTASGAPTPLSAFLFIAASCVGVIESLSHYMMIRYKPTPKDDGIEDAWLIQADQIREKNQQTFAFNEMLIRVGFALAMTAIVTVWCFIPGSIVLTLGFMAGMAMLGWIESLTVSKLESRNAIKLQKLLQEAREKTEEISIEETSTPSMVKELSEHSASLQNAKTSDERVSYPASVQRDSGAGKVSQLGFLRHRRPETQSLLENGEALAPGVI